MKFINKYKSPNYNRRKNDAYLKFIIIHYTVLLSDKEVINHLCEKKRKVSSHFFINKKGKIYNLVDVEYRSWHAGKSYWKGEKDLNSFSLGIEMENSGHYLKFENYTLAQKSSLKKLLIFLKKKYKIKSENILGHSDISPYRKIDPGQKFPWKELANKNIVFSPIFSSKYNHKKIENYLNTKLFSSKRKKVLYMLKKIGYNIEPSRKSNKKFILLIDACQMHYRNLLVNGRLDNQTYEIIKSHFNHLLTIENFSIISNN